MDSEIVRFRIDARIRAQAEATCARLGVTLADVLRATVARIARDGALPFALEAPAAAPEAAAFGAYRGPPWDALLARVQAERALERLARRVAACSIALDAERQRAAPDPKRLAHLARERERALAVHAALDVTDAAAVAAVLGAPGAPAAGG